jgi:hypothetical protein
MNVQNHNSRRRRGQAMLRTLLAVGTLVSGLLAYLLSSTSRVESIILPGIVMGLVAFGVALYSRTRNRREWSAAWDAYAKRDVDRTSGNRWSIPDESLSLAGTH